MKQNNKNSVTNSNKNSTNSQKDSYSNSYRNCGSVEPLPESSRPRRDGPGGEDAE